MAYQSAFSVWEYPSKAAIFWYLPTMNYMYSIRQQNFFHRSRNNRKLSFCLPCQRSWSIWITSLKIILHICLNWDWFTSDMSIEEDNLCCQLISPDDCPSDPNLKCQSNHVVFQGLSNLHFLLDSGLPHTYEWDVQYSNTCIYFDKHC